MAHPFKLIRHESILVAHPTKSLCVCLIGIGFRASDNAKLEPCPVSPSRILRDEVVLGFGNELEMFDALDKLVGEGLPSNKLAQRTV